MQRIVSYNPLAILPCIVNDLEDFAMRRIAAIALGFLLTGMPD
jgi:hypothetical protein